MPDRIANIEKLINTASARLAGRLGAYAARRAAQSGNYQCEAADLQQCGLIAAFRAIRREAARHPGKYHAGNFDKLEGAMFAIGCVAIQQRLIDHYRRTDTAAEYAPQVTVQDRDDRDVVAAECRLKLRAIQQNLPPRLREVFDLVVTHGRKDIARLAEEMGVAPPTAYRLFNEMTTAAFEIAGPPPAGA